MVDLVEMIRGLVLGLGEILPISGMGHLTILEQANLMPSGSTAPAKLGVLLAVLLVYHKTVFGMLGGICAMIGGLYKGTFKWRKAGKDQMMAVYLMLASLPLILMAAFRQFIAVSGGLLFTGIMLLVSAGLIFIGSHSLCRNWTVQDMKPAHALKWGLFRAVSILPGLSPSGVAISMGLNMGFDRQTALDFSMLLSVPAILCDLCLGGGGAFRPAGLAGLFAAAVTAAAAIFLLKWLVKKDRFGWFMAYCAAAGIAAIVLNFVL